MMEALEACHPKNTFRRPRMYKMVACSMPWCSEDVLGHPNHLVSEEFRAYACGTCRIYLKSTARRYAHSGKSWREWGSEAVRGALKSPNEPEPCAMSWCTNLVHREDVCRQYGPKGEALCNTDRMYLYMYARRKSVTFAKAFETAPPPRLLHMRGRK